MTGGQGNDCKRNRAIGLATSKLAAQRLQFEQT
jgi:hypothetical protein